MNNDWSDFCEGDSGIVVIPHNEKITRLIDGPEKAATKSLGINEFVAEIHELANNESNPIEARISAYELIWKVTMDRFKGNDPTLRAKPND